MPRHILIAEPNSLTEYVENYNYQIPNSDQRIGEVFFVVMA